MGCPRPLFRKPPLFYSGGGNMWEPKLPLALLSARGYFGSHMLSPLNFSNHLLKVLFALCPLPLLSLFTKFCQDLGQDLRQHPVTSQNKKVRPGDCQSAERLKKRPSCYRAWIIFPKQSTISMFFFGRVRFAILVLNNISNNNNNGFTPLRTLLA